MKNIEKIGIDTLLDQFNTKYKELIEASISARNAVEIAQQNFKKVAGTLMSHGKDTAALIAEDQLSEDAMKYVEDRLSGIMKIPFKFNHSA